MSGSGARTEKFALGIAGVSLGQTSRQIPAGEPPPLAPNADLAVIGKSIPRIGGHAMVTGAARYTVDVRLPGMLFARILRSPHPHARILSIDTSAAERHAGVRAVHVVTENSRTAARPATVSALGATPTVRYVGASIAAIAATTRSSADEAIRLIKVNYEILPFVVDMDEARQPNAPRVFEVADSESGGADASRVTETGNVFGPTKALSLAARAAMSRKVSARRTSSSMVSFVRKCRRIAALNRMQSLPIGGRKV